VKILKTIVLFFLLTPIVIISQNNVNDEQLAIQYLINKEYDKANELFETLYEKRPDTYYYTYYLRTLLELKDYNKAEKLIKKHRKKNKELQRFSVDLGYIYEVSGENTKAQKEFKNAIETIEPNTPQIIDLANAFLSYRKTELAIKTYERGRSLLKNNKLFCIEIASIYQVEGNINSMMDEYFNFIEEDSKNVVSVQERLQSVFLDDNDGSKYETIRKSILRQTQKNPDKKVFSILMYWLSLQQRDFETALIQLKSIDKRFKDDTRIYEFANIAIANREWNIASEALKYIIDKGEKNENYTNSKISLLDVEFRLLTSKYPLNLKNLQKLDSEYSKFLNELGYNALVLQLIRNQATLKAYYLEQIKQAMIILDSVLKQKNISLKDKAILKIDLADIKLYDNDVWESTLLYSQVEKDFPNDTIGHEAKFRNAKLSFYIGEFEWAKAQLDVLRAATSKYIANDAMQLYFLIMDNEDEDSTFAALNYYAKADFLIFRNKDTEALKYFDSINMLALSNPLSDEVLFKKAEMFIKQGKYQIADSLLCKLADFYADDILADDALFRAAEINQYYLKNKQKAIDLYQNIIINFSSSIFVVEARKRYRELRGE